MSNLVLSDGTQIHYKLLDGDLEKPYLVFLHEGLGCIEMWRNFPKNLCEKTNCPGLVYDRSGYGKSSPVTHKRDIGYLHDYALKELPEVIEILIPQKDHILVGHSDGATIALIYATDFFPQLQGLVAEAAHVFVEAETIRGVRSADEAYNRNGPGGLIKYHGEKTRAVFKSWSETWLSEWFRGWNIVEILSSIRCPVLLIQGENDHFGTTRQIEAITCQAAGTTVSRLLEGCGHTPHLEKPGLVLDLTADFINDLIVLSKP